MTGLKNLIDVSGYKQLYLARQIGMRPCVFNDRLHRRRLSFSSAHLTSIANTLGLDVETVREAYEGRQK